MTASTFLITALAFLTFGSAFFSGSEVALFSLSSMRIRAYRHDNDPKKRLISELLNRPRDLLVTVFMMNTLVNILLQNVASKLFGEAAGWGLKVGVPLLLTLFLGEIIPKNICMQNNVSISLSVIPYINFFHRKLATLRKATVAITHPISRILFFYLKKEEKISEEELEHVLKASEKHGILNADEATLVRGYLTLQTATVKEIMVPEEDILYYKISDPLTKLLHLLIDQECSRLPVCNENLDNVLGVISAKQFFLHGHKIKDGKAITRLLYKPFYVPETTPIYSLMRQLDEANQVLALAVDEYGSVTGLVTREDIVEQVVGEITDRRSENPLFSTAGPDEIICSGKYELAEFNKQFGVELKSSTNMVTIGGWLIERVGNIPKVGATFEEENFLFQVLAATPKRIRRLYVRKVRSAL